jgi:hypothetical protein
MAVPALVTLKVAAEHSEHGGPLVAFLSPGRPRASRPGTTAIGRNREQDALEAFSDGVIAIIITIMVLELRPPHGESFPTLKPLLPYS